MKILEPAQLNRATLQRQLLLERRPIDVVGAVRHLVALQAQEAAAPYLALWNRIADLDFDEVDMAFDQGTLVKAPLMRITLHAVATDDYGSFHAAATPILRAARLNDRRYRDTGLSVDDADRAVPALVELLTVARSKDEILDHLAEAVSDEPRLWWALRTFAPIVHAPNAGPWSFTRTPRYRAAPDVERPDHDQAVAILLRRYLAAFGPATVADFAQFSLLPMTTIKPAVTLLRDELVRHADVDDRELVDVGDAPPVPEPDTRAPPRLLGMWDSILLAYRDRSRVVPEHIRPHVIRRNGDVLPTVLVDGYVSGTWRMVDDGIEIATFVDLPVDTWDQLEVEARSVLDAVVERDPKLFRRVDSWWAKLPDIQRRTLGQSP